MVDEAWHLQGIVTRAAIVEALRERGGQAAVASIMERDVPTVPEAMPLETVFTSLTRQQPCCVGVTDKSGRLRGYLTLENMSELIMIGASRRRHAQHLA